MHEDARPDSIETEAVYGVDRIAADLWISDLSDLGESDALLRVNLYDHMYTLSSKR
jgi:hypothetical protein